MTDRAVGDWVAELPFKIPFMITDLIADPIDSLEEVGEGDEVIGTLTDEERLARSLTVSFGQLHAEAKVRRQFSRTDEDRHQAEMECEEAYTKAEVFSDLFWVMVNENHGLWGVEAIGIRKGWKIVKPITQAPQTHFHVSRIPWSRNHD